MKIVKIVTNLLILIILFLLIALIVGSLIDKPVWLAGGIIGILLYLWFLLRIHTEFNYSIDINTRKKAKYIFVILCNLISIILILVFFIQYLSNKDINLFLMILIGSLPALIVIVYIVMVYKKVDFFLRRVYDSILLYTILIFVALITTHLLIAISIVIIILYLLVV